ncbi:Calcium/calmodulin-dependent protein kinase type II alpha chain, partial [Dissostichus eleginoides]
VEVPSGHRATAQEEQVEAQPGLGFQTIRPPSRFSTNLERAREIKQAIDSQVERCAKKTTG